MAVISAVDFDGIFETAASMVLQKAEPPAEGAADDGVEEKERLIGLFRKFHSEFRSAGGFLKDGLLISVPYSCVGDFVRGIRSETGSFPEYEDGRIYGWLDGAWMTFDMTAFFRRHGIEDFQLFREGGNGVSEEKEE